MNRNVIFVPGGYWQADTIRKLKKNNSINSIVIDDDLKAPGKKYSDFIVDVKSHKIAKIKSFLKKKKIKDLLVMPLFSDYGVKIKNQLRPKNNNFDYNIFSNKFLFRKKLKKERLSDCIFSKATNLKKIPNNKKLISKPIVGSGSKNVKKFLNKKILNKQLLDKKNFLVEEFVHGNEFAIDGFVLKNTTFFYFIAQKEKTKKSDGLVSKVYKQNKLSKKILQKIKRLITKTLKSLNYIFGPFHAEIILNNDKIHIIEIHPRGAGYDVGSKFIKTLTNVDPQQLEIDYLLDKKIELINFKPKIKYKNFCIRFFPNKKSGKIRYIYFKKFRINKKIKIIKKIFYKKGSVVKNSLDDSSRLCYLMLFSKNKDINLTKVSDNILKKHFKVKYYE